MGESDLLSILCWGNDAYSTSEAGRVGIILKRRTVSRWLNPALECASRAPLLCSPPCLLSPRCLCAAVPILNFRISGERWGVTRLPNAELSCYLKNNC